MFGIQTQIEFQLDAKSLTKPFTLQIVDPEIVLQCFDLFREYKHFDNHKLIHLSFFLSLRLVTSSLLKWCPMNSLLHSKTILGVWWNAWTLSKVPTTIPPVHFNSYRENWRKCRHWAIKRSQSALPTKNSNHIPSETYISEGLETISSDLRYPSSNVVISWRNVQEIWHANTMPQQSMPFRWVNLQMLWFSIGRHSN